MKRLLLATMLAMPAYADTSATISWVTPTQYTDNSPLTVAGYRVYYGNKAAGPYPTMVQSSASPIDIKLGAGTYYFVVTAYDSAGIESVFSNEVSKTIAPIVETLGTWTLKQGSTNVVKGKATVHSDPACLKALSGKPAGKYSCNVSNTVTVQ